MRRRTRRPDKKSLGPSAIAPFIPGEPAMVRHARRKGIALASVPVFASWCEAAGWKIEVKNDGHHWILLRWDGILAEWWPSSAKLVLNKKWNRGIHCHDVDQLREVLRTQRK